LDASPAKKAADVMLKSTDDHLYYRLFHRPASAVLEAERFKMDEAAMIVHSFSPESKWLSLPYIELLR
jgi:hypothetical protein